VVSAHRPLPGDQRSRRRRGKSRTLGLALPLGTRRLLRPGDYTLTVTAPGYYPYQDTIEVTKAASQRQEILLQPLPGLLTLDSTPEGAQLLIDGEVVGETPISELPVEAGAHELLLRAPRYLELSQPLEVTGREVQQRLTLVLDPAWADVAIASTPAGASILLDGEPAGTTPATIEVLQGERELSLQLPGFAQESRSISAEAGIAQDLGTITLTPATGVLTLSSVPAAPTSA
jgi:hypothetical protein